MGNITADIISDIIHKPELCLSLHTFLQRIFDQAISADNLQMLNILFEAGYDINLALNNTTIFNRMWTTNGKYMPQIKFSTFMHLEKLGINISEHVGKVCMIFCHSNDSIGLGFCLDNGVNVDHVFQLIIRPVHIEVIICLLRYNPNLNKLNLSNIEYIMGFNGDNYLSIIHLIENGLDISEYLYEFLSLCVYRSTNMLKYFINMGIDADTLNKLLPKACESGNFERVELLLANGADIHYNNNSILNFIYTDSSVKHSNKNWFNVTKLLIKNGAITNNIIYTFCAYICKISICGFDEELFTYFLELGIDVNSKFDMDVNKGYEYNSIEYILDAIVYLGYIDLFKLCLKYGADPYINNHSPLKIAIKQNKLDIIKLLLDLGSVVNPELNCPVEQSTIDLLDTYQINHKLKKLINK